LPWIRITQIETCVCERERERERESGAGRGGGEERVIEGHGDEGEKEHERGGSFLS
jgi:hypothetical protein